MSWFIYNYIGVTDATAAAVNPIHIAVGTGSVGLLVVVITTIVLVVWHVKKRSKKGM